mmetsp:Transcript_114036/g.333278  ORF Transcript_114036/g.333278 Transcript_114036/m.333278 type:complete len:207 (-) Transcript_114036:847-1467(-)
MPCVAYGRYCHLRVCRVCGCSCTARPLLSSHVRVDQRHGAAGRAGTLRVPGREVRRDAQPGQLAHAGQAPRAAAPPGPTTAGHVPDLEPAVRQPGSLGLGLPDPAAVPAAGRAPLPPQVSRQELLRLHRLGVVEGAIFQPALQPCVRYRLRRRRRGPHGHDEPQPFGQQWPSGQGLRAPCVLPRFRRHHPVPARSDRDRRAAGSHP